MWTLKFISQISNFSIQIGDSVFTSGGTSTVGASSGDGSFTTSDSLNLTTNEYSSTISYIGTVNDVIVTGSGFSIIVNPGQNSIPPAANSYIFFSKNQDVNVSSIKGYYNAVKFKNDSKYRAELHAVSCSITASSK